MNEKLVQKRLVALGVNHINSLFYVGTSMYPTLRNLDILSILHYESSLDIGRGDVIVFRSRASHRMIVHRVIAIEIEGVRTRGDNMGIDDSSLTLFNQIIGKVDFLDRGLKCLPVNGGFPGMITHYVSKLRRKLYYFRKLKSWANSLIYIINNSKLVKSFLTQNDEIRTYVFTHPDRTVIRSFHLNSLKIAPISRHFNIQGTVRTTETISNDGKKSETNQIEVAS